MARIKVPIDEDIALAANVVRHAEAKAQSPKTPAKPKKQLQQLPQVTPKQVVAGLIGVLIALVIGLGLQSIRLHRELREVKSNPQAAVERESQALINRVSKLTELPQGEAPLIGTVSDAVQAKAQSAFFENAQDGDKVLQYSKANTLILYRPSTDTIVKTGSLEAQP